MRRVPLDEAIWEIAQAARTNRMPFFFLVGAGVSAPEIPLATAIADDCQRRVSEARDTPDAPLDPLDRYSFWFERAFPQPRQRQQYLEEILAGARVSHASLRLAHLLSAGVLGRLVVTLNFDEGLERALSLFDVPFLVCDHPATVERIDPDRDTTQIVHVHGTYWFYDCCNLRGEIADRASQATQGMQSLLDRVLANRSPLVLGYSGWESDVFMTSLRRRLAGRLPYNIYWFSYDGAIDELPEWLREHQDVVFVVPGGTESLKREGSPTDSIDAPVLEAATCLEAIIRHFSLVPPKAVDDPIGALILRLSRQIPSLGVDAGYEDLYQLGGVIERLEQVVYEIRDTPRSSIEEARESYRSSEYERALDLCLALPVIDDESESQVAGMIASSLVRARSPISMLISSHPTALDRIRAAAQRAPSLRIQLGTVLNTYGRELASKQPETALTILDEAINLDAGDSEARKRQILRAYNIKSTAFAELDRWDEVVDIMEKVLRVGGDSIQLQDIALVAEVNGATALVRMGRAPEANAIYRKLRPRVSEQPRQDSYWRFMLRFMEGLDAAGEQTELMGLALAVLEAAESLGDGEVAREAVEMAHRVVGKEIRD